MTCRAARWKALGLSGCFRCATWSERRARHRLRVEARLWASYFVDGGALDGQDATRLAKDLVVADASLPGLVDAVVCELEDDARTSLWLAAPCLPWRHRERRERAMRALKVAAAKVAFVPNLDLTTLGEGVRAMVANEHINLARARALIAAASEQQGRQTICDEIKNRSPFRMLTPPRETESSASLHSSGHRARRLSNKHAERATAVRAKTAHPMGHTAAHTTSAHRPVTAAATQRARRTPSSADGRRQLPKETCV